MIAARPGELPSDLLERSGLPGAARPVIVVCGDAGKQTSKVAEAVCTAATRAGAATLIDYRDDALARSLEDERAADPAAPPLLLGVAPAPAAEGDATAASSFSHVVLAPADGWGGEPPLAGVAGALSGGAAVVLVLVGGDEGMRAELRHALRRRWPVLAVEGTGGLADRVVAAAHDSAADASLAGDVRGRDVRVVAAGDWHGLAREAAWELQDAPGLKDAWALFATYDDLANGLRAAYERFTIAVLVLGIIATAIALAHDVAGKGLLKDVLHWGSVASPILVSVLIALANRRRSGNRWVLLRAAAEAVKSEIYSCRTRAGHYADAKLAGPPAVSIERRLADRLGDIEQSLGHTAASDGPLTAYSGPLPPQMFGAEARDDGLSELDAARYVETRIADQMSYYRGRVGKLDRRRWWLQVVTLGAGGVGALLAAAGAEVWIGLTTAIAGGALAYLANLQVDGTIVSYNQAAAQLARLERSFKADGAAGTDLDRLVTDGEDVLTKELGGWVQQMTEALERQREEQEKAAAGEDPAAGDPAGGSPAGDGPADGASATG